MRFKIKRQQKKRSDKLNMKTFKGSTNFKFNNTKNKISRHSIYKTEFDDNAMNPTTTTNNFQSLGHSEKQEKH